MGDQSKSDSKILEDFRRNNIALKGEWEFKITRANGDVEINRVANTLSSAGLNKLAQLGVTNSNSAFLYLAVGTQSEASSLGSVQAGMGEVSRKMGATITTSKEFMILVATWAGAADGVTSLDLRTASAVNHATSGSGEHLNFVNSVSTTLADSDFLRIQMDVRVGSHDL